MTLCIIEGGLPKIVGNPNNRRRARCGAEASNNGNVRPHLSLDEKLICNKWWPYENDPVE